MALHPLLAQVVLPTHNRDGSMEQKRKAGSVRVYHLSQAAQMVSSPGKDHKGRKRLGEGRIRAQHLRGCQEHVVIKINDSLM